RTDISNFITSDINLHHQPHLQPTSKLKLNHINLINLLNLLNLLNLINRINPSLAIHQKMTDSTPFVEFLRPPGDLISPTNYTRTILPTQQPSALIPQVFKDAMEVRAAVFVTEQHVPLDAELDAQDARAFHWVVYASVGTKTSLNGRKGSETRSLPVGTIRLVPPPPIEPAESTSDEPYITLGRLAVLQPYRRLGLGALLVRSALEWAAAHAREIRPEPSGARREEALADQRRRSGGIYAAANAAFYVSLAGEGVRRAWEGLVRVHAQRDAEVVWRRYGFVRDEQEPWPEEGIWHVGMWTRLKL
ncbi:MAG: hypothetical protein M1829_001810, partial [Trizodia sp. TS-e1964]